MFANEPAMARRWARETPSMKKLPDKKGPEQSVKRAYEAGVADAFVQFGLKLGAEEIRLQIPRRQFHGWDAAWRNLAANAEKKAAGEPEDAAPVPLEPQAGPDSPVERLTAMLQQLDLPGGPRTENATKDRLERDVLWGAPSNLAAGDAANRVSDMGQPTNFGGVF
jgi:hypothetical protein